MSKLIKKPHQQRAVDDIIHGEHGIVKAGRAMYISACATGKTLSGLWAAEEYLFNHVDSEEKIAVFLFPSLALISQTYNAFMSQTLIDGYNPLVVCSETKIGQTAEDPEETPDDSIIYETCTNIANVQAYLTDTNIKTKVIFVTYHSASIVGQALIAQGLFADIGIFDEAHRTAQQGDTQNMSYALSDENFPIRKRLFMTATPKHIASSDEDEKAEFSMDNIEVYGEIAHELPMRQAIEEGLICDYSIIAGAMESDEEVNDENAISVIAEAFIRGIKKTGVKTAIAFQKNIATSKAFAQWVSTHYPDIQIRHIDGTMHHAERESVMQFLRDGGGVRIVTNSKILSEGVDAPAVDMVGFLSNVASEIDIVQRVGRVQRLLAGFPDKIGYVFVPVITNSQKEIIYGKESLLSVVANLRENDEQLRAETVAFTGGGKNSKSVEVVNLDEVASGEATIDMLALSMIQNKINAILLGGAETVSLRWKPLYIKLSKFIDENKRLPLYSDDVELALWCYTQKKSIKRHLLAADKIQMLVDLTDGKIVDYNLRRHPWFKSLEKAEEDYKKCGDLNFIGFDWSRQWLLKQRRNHANKTLSVEFNKILVEVFGEKWNQEIDTDIWFKAKIEEVKEYLQKYKIIPRRSKQPTYPKQNELGSWVNTQICKKNAGKMPKEQESKLVELFGEQFFYSGKGIAKFKNNLDDYVDFCKKRHIPPIRSEDEKEKKISHWVLNTRKKINSGKLTEEEKKLLLEKAPELLRRRREKENKYESKKQ